MEEKDTKILELQLERHTKLITEGNEDLEYNKSLIEKKKYLRNHEDKWRDFLRLRDEEYDNNVLKTIELNIKDSEQHIKEITKQLKEVTKISTYHS